ncbi:MAG: DUF4242 domain-containing protein [Thermomicrobiales bacterium]|nr:MAG: DUF4242 domain-containing protein [Thermomicrobiales bacterium]
MPRYVIERVFPDGLHVPIDKEGAANNRAVIARNLDYGVTWVHSYVSEDKLRSYCVYDGPNPEAIRKAAGVNNLPVEKITKVTVLDPYFYS